MNPAVYTAAGVIFAAIVTGLVTWSIARHAKSGKIDTSEAAVLWDEGTKMRQELRDEVASLRAQLNEAITAVSELNREIKQSRREAALARAETEAAREETRKSREETRHLMAQIEEIHGEVKTSNALTIGALADNTETRRILLIDSEDRSDTENEHLDTAGDRLPQTHRPHIPNPPPDPDEKDDDE